jgi:hypothetical protein
MRNIFMLYMPPGNAEAMVHYEDTIRQKVSSERIYSIVSREAVRKLQSHFGARPIAVWGSRDTPANRSRFDRMLVGDEILIVEGASIKLLGRVAYKIVSPELSRELWKNIRGDSTAGWDLIYFIANPREIDLPFAHFSKLFGYAANYRLHGFTSIADEKLEAFYSVYDDLYSVLLRIKQGGKPVKYADRERVVNSEQLSVVKEEASAFLPNEEVISDHVRMQWKLLSLGLKAGERVWAPRADQSRINEAFHFASFEESFAAGLNAQVKYVENIDVVWKQEFRIDAAFEVENSTAIYSGLLRFADLTMVAPNTLYPMFIVAPGARRSRVEEQLSRPVFRHLRLGDKVRYLSYEAVDEVEEFFGDAGRGVNVDVFVGKSEKF